tara:strand:+ start:338 stop:466 length:129 start_codon:yes stop_codon:yes gene_type:complete
MDKNNIELNTLENKIIDITGTVKSFDQFMTEYKELERHRRGI